jgi:glucarate dehydratase
MKIREMIITPIAIVDPPLLNAAGLHAPYALRTVVELVTDDHISGISEIPGNIDIDAALGSARELLIGKDPFQLNQIRHLLENAFGRETAAQRGDAPWDQRKLVHIFSAIEVACMDIIGKVMGLPVVDLLGGRMRSGCLLLLIFFINMREPGESGGLVQIRPRQDGRPPARQRRWTLRGSWSRRELCVMHSGSGPSS